jgi:hypothetical protein
VQEEYSGAQRHREYAALVQQRARIDDLQEILAEGDRGLDLALVVTSGLTKGAEEKIAKNKKRVSKRTEAWETLANELGVSPADDAHSSGWSSSK